MQIVCHQCGAAVDVPDHTQAGAPVTCPSCGHSGSYQPTQTRGFGVSNFGVGATPRNPKRTASATDKVVLGILVGGCLGTGLATSQPWLTVALSGVLMALCVAIGLGKIGRSWSSRWPVVIGGGLLALFLGGLAISTLGTRFAAQEAQALAAAEAAEAEGQRLEQLRADAETRMDTARQHIAEAETAITELNRQPFEAAAAELAPLAELDPSPEGYPELRDEVAALTARLDAAGAAKALDEATVLADDGDWEDVRSALGRAKAYVDALGAAAGEHSERHSALRARATPFWNALSAIATARAVLEQDHEDAVAAEEAYDRSLASMEAIEGDPARTYARDIQSVRSQLRRKRGRNHRRAERLRRDRAELDAQRILCGDAPTLSAWDGELIGSEYVMQRSAHDPDSIDVEACTQPALARDRNHCWLTTCTVRGRNAFGAMISQRKQFEVRRGEIVSVR